MTQKRIPQGVETLDQILKTKYGGFDEVNRIDIKDATRKFLISSRECAERCHFDDCDECKDQIRVIDLLLDRIDSPVG